MQATAHGLNATSDFVASQPATSAPIVSASGVRVGRILGIPVTVNWSVIFVALFVVYTLTVQILPRQILDASLRTRLAVACASAVLFFISILGHELGHALAARRHNVAVGGITLWFFGGMATMLRRAPTPKAEFQIAAAGPAASLGFGVLFAGAAGLIGSATDLELFPVVLVWLAAVNVLLAVSNMIPASPLDGGRVLTAMIWKRRGDADAARLISARCGLILGGLSLAIAFGFMWFTDQPDIVLWLSLAFSGMFIAVGARGEVASAVIVGRLNRTNVGDLMVSHPATVPDSWTMSQLLGWVPPDSVDVAFPVVRWGNEPVGLVAPKMASRLPVPDRSWTTISSMMLPIQDVPRAWTSESINEVLERVGVAQLQPVMAHDAKTGRWLGTLTSGQTEHLFTPPDFWGRDRKPAQALTGGPAR